MTTEITAINLLTADALLQHWQGHRNLTRRTIDAFPDDKLFQFSIGGMRSFSEIACEFMAMSGPLVHGVATGQWEAYDPAKPQTKADLLRRWDEQTVILNEQFPRISAERFNAVDRAFGQWEMTGLAMIQYAVDNEIHHRGQGFVYLRALGIEPPPFWERN